MLEESIPLALKQKRRWKQAGFTISELMIAMIIIAIVASIAVGSGLTALDRTRISATRSIFDKYNAAFLNACVSHPGIVTDRKEAWGATADSYTSDKGLGRLVRFMNESLDAELKLTWDANLKCYKAFRKDEWGGMYLLTEMPYKDDTTLGVYDASAAGSAVMCAAIWSTGKSDALLSSGAIDSKTLGMSFVYQSGIVSALITGVDEEIPYDGYKIKFS